MAADEKEDPLLAAIESKFGVTFTKAPNYAPPATAPETPERAAARATARGIGRLAGYDVPEPEEAA